MGFRRTRQRVCEGGEDSFGKGMGRKTGNRDKREVKSRKKVEYGRKGLQERKKYLYSATWGEGCPLRRWVALTGTKSHSGLYSDMQHSIGYRVREMHLFPA